MSEVYSHQGTWQFMAAHLVQTPSTPHIPIYDLESVFWVLMWITLTYTHTNWSVGSRSSFLRETMNPRVFMDSRGTNKLSFMHAHYILGNFTVDQNPQLTHLICVLKDILFAYHDNRASKEAGMAIKGLKVVQVDDLEEPLTHHQEVLQIFNNVLESPNWPDNDEAQRQYIVVSNDVQTSMHSSSKRSREVAEENGVYSLPPPAKRSGTA